ncbi:hypothetical protein AAFF_G00433220 [Aldrovandia affinis]|uniref:Uncharacterized protein n=1 Tax=Aldrovandia affinis TaxID=143900 RepID=A0AAD7S8L4_9TELE|nr:hypothetical protein AAFF_G00433220 [Aldrovandia affinis]
MTQHTSASLPQWGYRCNLAWNTVRARGSPPARTALCKHGPLSRRPTEEEEEEDTCNLTPSATNHRLSAPHPGPGSANDMAVPGCRSG